MHKNKIKKARKNNLTATVCALSLYSIVRKNIFFSSDATALRRQGPPHSRAF